MTFATGKYAFGFCDRCGQRYDLNDIKKETQFNGAETGIRVCSECTDAPEPDQRIRINDPQALMDARPDRSYSDSGNEGGGGSRMIQWGWNPIGGASNSLTPNSLVSTTEVGTVTVVVT